VRALDEHYAVGEFSLQLFGWDRPRRFVVIRNSCAPSALRWEKLLDVPGYTFRVFVTNLALPPNRFGATTTAGPTWKIASPN